MADELQRLSTFWQDKDGGWTLLPDLRHIDSAEEGEESSVSFKLDKGVTYKLVGRCDENCSDLALILTDSKGVVTGKGYAGLEEIPIDFVAPATGDYKLSISMDACDDYYCDYGVDVYKAGMSKAVTTQTPANPRPPPVAASPAAPTANAGSDDQARRNLQARYDYWKDKDSGWTLLPALRAIGSTREGYSQTITYTLAAGAAYKIMGACDDSCTNLDLKVTDAAGKLLASDVDKDNIPILNLTPASSGKFTVTASMTACKQASGCSYGVDVYQAAAAAPQPVAPAAAAAPMSASEAQTRSNLDDRFKYWSGVYTIFPNSRTISQLSSGEKVDISVKDFRAGVALQLMGACDDDCSSLTLELRDAAGKLLDSDTSDLAIPHVGFTPNGTDVYTLTVKMDDCARPDGCTFGVEVYQAK